MTEGEFLKYMKRKMAEQKQGPEAPLKKHKPKVTRMSSPRMRTVEKGTINSFRASYQTPEQAKRNTVVGEPKVATREVGPGDKYNKTNDYTMGKDTESRKPKEK